MGTLDRIANRWNSTVNVREPGFDYERMAYLVRLGRNQRIAAIYLLVSILLFVLSVYVMW